MRKVFLSAGHGGNDPGAVAYGLKEKNINLNIMLACRDELVRNGVEVVCSRTKDENDPVTSEAKEANTSGAEVAVSFHTNAGKGDGSETFYFSGNANGKRLAELCEKHTKEIGQNSRGVKPGDNLYFIRKTKMPAVLCECAFVDNDKDNNAIDTVAEQKAFGVAYAKAILEYLGVNAEEAKPEKTEQVETVKPQPVEPAVAQPKKNVAEKKPSVGPDKAIAGTYVTTANVYIRNGAGMRNKYLTVIPKGTKCENYGYYSKDAGVNWLYVQTFVSGVQYTGFVSSKFLKRV